jgi:hypothetical protein
MPRWLSRPRWTGLPKWRQILYALLGLTVVVAAVVYGRSAAQKPDTCADGVERIDDECIGVNGEGYDFGTPEIRAVTQAIKKENDRIAEQPHVTVAMMLPLQSDQPTLRRQMRSDLQGAYLGQRQANAGEGELPKIRLVLANPGRNYGRQDEVVDTLIGMAGSSKDRLRAVTGFNLSLDATEKAVERLTKHGIPVLASRITGDRIANEDGTDGAAKPRFPGLARIVPTNNDAAEALADFNGERGRQDARTVLVFDTRQDAYDESLANAFRGIKEAGPAGPAAMPFESPGITRRGQPATSSPRSPTTSATRRPTRSTSRVAHCTCGYSRSNSPNSPAGTGITRSSAAPTPPRCGRACRRRTGHSCAARTAKRR